MLTPQGYRPRLIDQKVSDMLNAFGAVSIEGPKWCGKTWTAENHAESEFKLTDRTGPIQNRDLAKGDSDIALKGDSPHLIDEWQEVPSIWDAVRSEVDKRQMKGRFLLTGSSVPKRESYIHSGAGRIGLVRMGTMSLYEMGESKGEASLRTIMNGGPIMTECAGTDLDRLMDLVIRGGWPANLGLDTEHAGLLPISYIEMAADDASRMDGRRRMTEKMRMIIRSLARNESTLASDATLMRDISTYDDESIAIETFREYMDCLERIHLIDDTPSFRPNVRSNMRVGKTPKRHLADVSLAVAALGMGKEMMRNDLNTFGFLLESLCEHDLRIYSEAIGGRLFHYRDGRGREADAVIEMPDGRWGAFEIKLGANQIDGAAENLLHLRDLYADEGRPPSSLCVACGLIRHAFRRPDGVYVVPITALGP